MLTSFSKVSCSYSSSESSLSSSSLSSRSMTIFGDTWAAGGFAGGLGRAGSAAVDGLLMVGLSLLPVGRAGFLCGEAAWLVACGYCARDKMSPSSATSFCI